MTSDTMLTYADTTQPIGEWALDYGIYPAVIVERLARGWTAELAITTPMIVAPAQRLSAEHMPNLPALVTRRRRRSRNARRSALGRTFEHNGEALTLRQWSDRVGLSSDTLRYRINSGQTLAQAISSPLRRKLTPRAAPGVPCDFPASFGTGGGCHAQDIPKIGNFTNDRT